MKCHRQEKRTQSLRLILQEMVKEALRELLSEVPAFREAMAGGKGKGKASGPGGASTLEGGNPSEHSKLGES